MKCQLENNKVGRTIIMMLLLLPIWVESRPSWRRLLTIRVSSWPTISPWSPSSTTRCPSWTRLLKQHLFRRKKSSSRHRKLCIHFELWVGWAANKKSSSILHRFRSGFSLLLILLARNQQLHHDWAGAGHCEQVSERRDKSLFSSAPCPTMQPPPTWAKWPDQMLR